MKRVVESITKQCHATEQVQYVCESGWEKLTSPVGDLQVSCGQVLLHVLLKRLFKVLLPLL